jgi:DNA-binding NarL/FixJ family response regulator
MTRRKSVVLIDDHPVVLDGLAYLLGETNDFCVVGETEEADAALELIERLQPAVVVLDLTLKGQEALPLLSTLSGRWPQLRILVLSMHDENLYAERLLSLGAHGYVMKQEQPTEFLRALRAVANGEVYLSETLRARLATRAGRQARAGGDLAARLTSREQDVLRLLARGLPTGEISARLHMSAKTVGSHRRNIRDKLGLATSRDLRRYAALWAGQLGTDGNPAA